MLRRTPIFDSMCYFIRISILLNYFIYESILVKKASEIVWSMDSAYCLITSLICDIAISVVMNESVRLIKNQKL